MNASDQAARLASTCLRAERLPAEQWRELCEQVSKLKAQEQAALVKPLALALRKLPDAVRIAPSQWLHRQRQGQRVPVLRLARSLVWTSPRLDDTTLTLLLRFPDLPKLTSLKLFGQSLTSSGAMALVQCPRLERLESLNLTSNAIDGAGLCALLDPGGFSQLRRLFLGRNRIDDAAAQWLMRTSLSPALELIDLRDNPLSDATQGELASCFQDRPIELRLQSQTKKNELPRRKRGRPAKKKPKT